MTRWSVVAVAATTGAILTSGLAWGQLQISTLVGRQIGDGRAATAASLDRPFGVDFAPDGALLIADRGHGRIRRVDPATGVMSTLVGSVPGARNDVLADQGELKGPLRVHVDPLTTDLIITDRDQHTVRRVIAATGILVRIAGTQDTPGATGDGGLATSALLDQPADAYPDATGGVLIVDRNNHKIRLISAGGTITTVAGAGTPGYTGDNVPGGAAVAQFNSPACVLPIPGGGFYVCDQLNNVIRRVDTATNTVTTVAGTGTAGFADGPAATAQLDQPANLAFDASGNLLIVDRNNNRLRRLDLGTNTVSTIAGNGTQEFTDDGGSAAGPITGPAAVALAPDGRIVFAEEGSHRVRAIDAAGNLVTLAGDGVNRFGGDGGPAVDAQFTQTKAVTRDLADRFIISDDGNARVRRLDPCTGLLETIAGTGSRAFGGDGGPALDAGLTPSDALVDAKGNLIVCDSDNDRIRIIDTTGVITTLVGTGVGGFSGDGGPATAAQINRPTGIEIDANGNLYIADFDNNAVRRVSGGIITTIAGTGTSGFNGDNIAATTANLANPSDIEIDVIGNVYIADFNNNRVRRVDPAGIITTVAGNGEAGATGDGGPATAARLFQPSDVKLDETGALWVTDSGNQRVRRFTVGGNIETVAGTGSRGYAGDGGPATVARLLFPVQLLVLSSQQVLVTDRDNFVVRALGTITTDCTKVADDCRGSGAPTCIPGGGKAKKDCFGEFKFKTSLPGRVPPPRLSCTDGDPACDADDVPGQCTFRVSLCLNNEDARLACSPGSTTSLKLSGGLAGTAGGQSMINAAGKLADSAPLSKGRGVSFPTAFSARNKCTPFSDFVVTRAKKTGKGNLGAVITTQGAGKDKDKLKLLCRAPA